MTFPYHFETIGSNKKPSLLFLHGFMGNIDTWRPIANQLSDDYFCILVDLPGHGRSVNLADQDYQFTRCAKNLIHLLDELKIDQTNLIGYSMGGRIGLYMALTYPDRLAKVILESAGVGIEDLSGKKERVEWDKELAAKLESMSFSDFNKEWYAMPMFGKLREHPEFESVLNERSENDTSELVKVLQGHGLGGQPSLWDQLKENHVPILHLVGEYDRKFVRIADRMAKITGSVKRVVIEDAAHYLHFEQEEVFLKNIKEFL